MNAFFWKLLKFGLTGLLGLGIDFGITWLLKEKLRVNKYLANSCGFTLAVCCNFWLNRHWTFGSNNPLWLQEFAKFLIVSLIGLLLNTGFLYFFHHKKNTNFYRAKFLSIVLVFVWNFSANFIFTFK